MEELKFEICSITEKTLSVVNDRNTYLELLNTARFIELSEKLEYIRENAWYNYDGIEPFISYLIGPFCHSFKFNLRERLEANKENIKNKEKIINILTQMLQTIINSLEPLCYNYTIELDPVRELIYNLEITLKDLKFCNIIENDNDWDYLRVRSRSFVLD